MSFDWNHYYFFAVRIVDPADVPKHDPAQLDAAAFRTAISRAYYAAFHRMVSVLKITRKELDEAPSVHSLVWTRAENDGRTNIQEAARVGKRMKASRGRADYDDAFAASLANEARNAVDDAKELYRLTR